MLAYGLVLLLLDLLRPDRLRILDLLELLGHHHLRARLQMLLLTQLLLKHLFFRKQCVSLRGLTSSSHKVVGEGGSPLIHGRLQYHEALWIIAQLLCLYNGLDLRLLLGFLREQLFVVVLKDVKRPVAFGGLLAMLVGARLRLQHSLGRVLVRGIELAAVDSLLLVLAAVAGDPELVQILLLPLPPLILLALIDV